jgi:hypothetical protein
VALKTTIETEGLGDLLRTLRRVDAGMHKGLTSELRGIGKEVQANVRGSTEDPHRSGKLRRSVKVSVRAGGFIRVGGVTLYSTSPQAGVWEWGGAIRPRGTPIEIPRTLFVRGEAYEALEGVEDRLAALFDALARGGVLL